MKPHEWSTAAERRQFVLQNDGKMRIADIAQMLGVSMGTVNKDRSELGLTHSVIHWDAAKRETVRRMFAEYERIEDIAAAIGFPNEYCTVRSYIGNILGLTRRRGIMVKLRHFPHLKPILLASGEDAFEDAARTEERRDEVEREELRQLREQGDAEKRKADRELVIATLALPISRREKVLRLRSQGITLELIGEELGITRERVRQIEGDIRPPKTGNPPGRKKQFPDAAIRAAYQRCGNITAVAQEFGCHYGTVVKALRCTGSAADNLLASFNTLEPAEQAKFLRLVQGQTSISEAIAA